MALHNVRTVQSWYDGFLPAGYHQLLDYMLYEAEPSALSVECGLIDSLYRRPNGARLLEQILNGGFRNGDHFAGLVEKIL